MKFLRVWPTDETLNDTQRTYAVGFVEGYLTREDIDVYRYAFVNSTWINGKPGGPLNYAVELQKVYWESYEGEEEMTHAQRMILSQFKGLYEGNKESGGSLSEEDMYLMATRGDMYELLYLYRDNTKDSSFEKDERVAQPNGHLLMKRLC